MAYKISVVVCSYNQAEFIDETLRSIVSQQYENLELIVIDGGSTDNSVEIIERYADHIAYWVSEPDGGQTKGLIKGFNRSTGEIQCWMNSDDLMAEGCLNDVNEYFQVNPEAEAVFGDTTWIDAKGRPLRAQKEIGFNRFLWMYTYNYIPGMSMYWKSSLYDKVGGLNPQFNLAMDADLWIRFSDVTRIQHVSRNWSFMRFYPEQKNRALRDRSDQEDLIIRSRYWKTEKPAFLGARRIIAQCLRIVLKALNGSYDRGYERFIADGAIDGRP